MKPKWVQWKNLSKPITKHTLSKSMLNQCHQTVENSCSLSKHVSDPYLCSKVQPQHILCPQLVRQSARHWLFKATNSWIIEECVSAVCVHTLSVHAFVGKVKETQTTKQRWCWESRGHTRTEISAISACTHTPSYHICPIMSHHKDIEGRERTSGQRPWARWTE